MSYNRPLWLNRHRFGLRKQDLIKYVIKYVVNISRVRRSCCDAGSQTLKYATGQDVWTVRAGILHIVIFHGECVRFGYGGVAYNLGCRFCSFVDRVMAIVQGNITGIT